MLEIKSFVFGPFGTNTYVVNNGQQVLLVDPACSNPYEEQMLYRYIEDLRFKIEDFRIIATHGHLDHLWGAKWASEQWHTPVLMHEADIPMAQAMQQQYDLFGIHRLAEGFPIEDIKSSILNLKSQIHPVILPVRYASIGRKRKCCFPVIRSFRWGTVVPTCPEEIWDN